MEVEDREFAWVDVVPDNAARAASAIRSDLILIFLLLKAFGIGGEHGPGRYAGSSDVTLAAPRMSTRCSRGTQE